MPNVLPSTPACTPRPLMIWKSETDGRARPNACGQAMTSTVATRAITSSVGDSTNTDHTTAVTAAATAT